MEDDNLVVGPALEKLERQFATKAETADDVYMDVEEEAIEDLQKARDVLKETCVLLEFLSNPTFCRSITERERKFLFRHLTRVEECIDDLTETINAASDEEDE